MGIVIPEEYSDSERDFFLKYNSMLFFVSLEKVREIYRCENAKQNPPWMPQLPLSKLKFMMPRTLAALVEKVQKEVCSDLKLMKRVEKENLLVRWAGKKRDHVDEILVRELQEEEMLWTDFSQDEVLVKDQMTDIILESLISDCCSPQGTRNSQVCYSVRHYLGYRVYRDR